MTCSRLRHTTLAHLSEECNSEEKARQIVSPYIPDIPLAIARQKEAGEIISL